MGKGRERRAHHPRGMRQWWARFALPTLRITYVRLRTNRLDIVAVGIDQERRVIGRAVIRARPGPPLSRPPALSPSAWNVDRRMVGRAERDMRAGRPSPCADEPERRRALGTETRARSSREQAQGRAGPAPPCRSARWRRGLHRNPMWSYMMFSSSERANTARPGETLAEWRASRSWKILRSPRDA